MIKKPSTFFDKFHFYTGAGDAAGHIFFSVGGGAGITTSNFLLNNKIRVAQKISKPLAMNQVNNDAGAMAQIVEASYP